MKTRNRWMIDREDLGDAALMAALTAIVLLSLEFLFTATFAHYISVPILAVEALVAVAAGALIASVAVKATDDED